MCLIHIHTCVFGNTHVFLCSHSSDSSDTTDTDNERSWGGLGKYEYSQKGLPHALFHYTELLMRAGHHQAYCTALVEAVHKLFIKKAAIYSQTVASHNKSFDSMLRWVLWQTLWEAVIELGTRDTGVPAESSDPDSSSDSYTGPMIKRLGQPLRDSNTNWSRNALLRGGRVLSQRWSSSFIEDRVRVTRLELMKIFCYKFGIDPDNSSLSKIYATLSWEFFGTLSTGFSMVSRKFVGLSSVCPGRHDFVRVKGTHERDDGVKTCLSAQIVLFVQISGFCSAGIELPIKFRNPSHNTDSVVFALVRWLSPHPDALLRDDELRPVCVSPFDINHAMWSYSKYRRPLLTDAIISANRAFYGDDEQTRERVIQSEKNARFDLLEPESFESYMNCTLVNADKDVILETVTLPFD